MTCEFCRVAKDFPTYKEFDSPKCMHCSARLLQGLRSLRITELAKRAREITELDSVERYGHDRQAVWELSLGTLPLDLSIPVKPLASALPKAKKRR